MLVGGAIAEAEIRDWALLGWPVAAYTACCCALSWWNQRRAGLTMQYFDCRTRAVFAGHVVTLSGLIAGACWVGLDRGIHGAFLAAPRPAPESSPSPAAAQPTRQDCARAM